MPYILSCFHNVSTRSLHNQCTWKNAFSGVLALVLKIHLCLKEEQNSDKLWQNLMTVRRQFNEESEE